MERTLFLVKPDAVARGCDADILTMVGENIPKGDIIEFVFVKKPIPRELAEAHYEEHKGTERFDRCCSLLCEGPLIKVVFEGKNIVNQLQELKPKIREKFAESISRNCIHTSDSITSAKREIELWKNIQ